MGVIKFGILGAGVIGLTTALELQSQFSNSDITIIADKFNEETTSDGAAGIFRPGTSFSAYSEETTRFIILESYRWYEELMCGFETSVTGVSEVSGYIFSSNSQSLVENELINKIVPVYRPATESELKLFPGYWKYGSYFTTIITECRKFLPWCMQRYTNISFKKVEELKEKCGKVIKKKITNLEDVISHNFDVVFNCLGFGAKDLLQDRKLVPIRGQVIKVSAPWLKNFFYADYDTYIIPGSDSVTLGGCRHYDSYNMNVDPYDSAAIWNRCTKVIPKLMNCCIEREWVGLRPHRDQVRIETETIKMGTKTIKFVHNYGHGGYGVTTAPGSAKLAVTLAMKFIKGASKL